MLPFVSLGRRVGFQSESSSLKISPLGESVPETYKYHLLSETPQCGAINRRHDLNWVVLGVHFALGY